MAIRRHSTKADDSSNAKEAARYTVDAAFLRFTIENNLNDHYFANRLGGRIRYIFDTNVFKLFMDPYSHRVYPRVSLFNRAADSRQNQALLRATAVMTAEFLFSGMLSGQFNLPVLVTPKHWVEIEGMIGKVRSNLEDEINLRNSDRFREKSATAPHPAEVIIELENIVDDVRRGQGNGIQALEQIKKRLPLVIQPLLSSAAYEGAQFLRLMEAGAFQNLQSDRIATSEILNPKLERVSHWKAELTKQKAGLIESVRAERHLSQHPAPLRGLSTREPEEARRSDIDWNFDNDAISLAQVEALNDAAADEPNPTRYVFVTTDRALFRAYASSFWSNRQTKPDFFALRFAWQYLPILNVGETRDASIEEVPFIFDIRDTLDTCLYGVREVDRDYPHILSFYASRLDAALDRNDTDAKQLIDAWAHPALFREMRFLIEDGARLARVRDLWTQASLNALVLNAALLDRRHEHELRRISEILQSEKELQTAAIEQQQELLRGLEQSHMNLMINNCLRDIRERDSKPAEMRPIRAPLAICFSFGDLTQGESLEEFFSKVLATDTNGQRQLIASDASSTMDSKRLFLAACIAHRIGLWASARHTAERALSRLENEGQSSHEKQHQKGEILYFLALATRFSMETFADYLAARNYLDQSDVLVTDDGISIWRNKCERAALQLSTVYAHAVNLFEDRRVSSRLLVRLFEDCGRSLQECSAAIKESNAGSSLRSSPYFSFICTQTCNNVLSYNALQQLSVEYRDAESIQHDVVEGALAFLKNALSKIEATLPLAVRLDYLIADALDGLRRASPKEVASKYLPKLNELDREFNSENSGFTSLDKKIGRFLSSRIRNRLGVQSA